MRIIQLVLIGVIAVASVAMAVGIFIVGERMNAQVDAMSGHNQLMADIQSELSAQTTDAVMLSVLNRWSVCDLVGVTADNDGNSANDEFYDERPWCAAEGGDPFIEAWDVSLTDDLAKYGFGVPNSSDG